MSSRVLIPLLCVGAVAFACGPRPGSEASTPRQSATSVAQRAADTSIVDQQGAPRLAAAAPKSPVRARISVERRNASIRLGLEVINTGKKRVEINFPSGQTYDFVVIDSVGREMWRWGSDRMFTQALRNKLLGAGERLAFEESVQSRVLPPGRYLARATLTSANFPLTEEAEFTVTATTIASR